MYITTDDLELAAQAIEAKQQHTEEMIEAIKRKGPNAKANHFQSCLDCQCALAVAQADSVDSHIAQLLMAWASGEVPLLPLIGVAISYGVMLGVMASDSSLLAQERTGH